MCKARAVLLPPQLRQSADHSVEQFMVDAAKLKEGADAARARSVKDGFVGDDDDGDGDEGGE